MATDAIDVRAELDAMQEMTATQLRAKYAELFGERSRSGNRAWLLRRCAWRVQSLAEGGLSQRAKRRAKQLARDQDIRVIPPAGATLSPIDRPADAVRPAPRRGARDRRLPMPGDQLTRKYKGHLYTVDVLDDGFDYDGRFYRSLSAVAAAITGSHWNGFKFFGLEDSGKDDR